MALRVLNALLTCWPVSKLRSRAQEHPERRAIYRRLAVALYGVALYEVAGAVPWTSLAAVERRVAGSAWYGRALEYFALAEELA